MAETQENIVLLKAPYLMLDQNVSLKSELPYCLHPRETSLWSLLKLLATFSTLPNNLSFLNFLYLLKSEAERKWDNYLEWGISGRWFDLNALFLFDNGFQGSVS